MNENELKHLIETEYSNIAGICILKNGEPAYEYFTVGAPERIYDPLQ